MVRLDNWERDSQYPNGHFVRSLGPIGELQTEVAALLVENQISVVAFTDSLVRDQFICDSSLLFVDKKPLFDTCYVKLYSSCHY